MTDRLASELVASSQGPAPCSPAERRVILASVAKLGVALALFVAVAVPDKEIAAKAFKLNLIVKNMRQRVGH